MVNHADTFLRLECHMHTPMDTSMDTGLSLHVLCANSTLLEKCAFMIITDSYRKHTTLSDMLLVWPIVCL